MKIMVCTILYSLDNTRGLQLQEINLDSIKITFEVDYNKFTPIKINLIGDINQDPNHQRCRSCCWEPALKFEPNQSTNSYQSTGEGGEGASLLHLSQPLPLWVFFFQSCSFPCSLVKTNSLSNMVRTMGHGMLMGWKNLSWPCKVFFSHVADVDLSSDYDCDQILSLYVISVCIPAKMKFTFRLMTSEQRERIWSSQEPIYWRSRWFHYELGYEILA